MTASRDPPWTTFAFSGSEVAAPTETWATSMGATEWLVLSVKLTSLPD